MIRITDSTGWCLLGQADENDGQIPTFALQSSLSYLLL